ncbi:MAG: hypothetical protein RML35_11940, partial [Chloroherpetonaceae bacterium]|nr:hypothetical protein [Chloroherpetonaceae bacterium]
QLLGKNAFPLSPRLDGYRLLIFAAFASAMANDELAEYDTFYNRLSEIFFENAPIDVNRQNQIRDFVEETCKRFNLRFLKNQNRLVRNTIWLHGGLPSRHWQNFFEYVLMKVDDNLGNLDTLLNPLTPRTIKRFFDHCGDSARAFLRDCIEMREVALSGELDNYSAEDFGVSENFLNAFREFLKSRCYERRQRQIIVFDETQLRVIDECTGQVIQPTQDIYAFRANGKRNLIRRGYKELPRKPVILIYHKDFTIPATIRRIVEKESLTGVWKDYVCEWLDLINQTELRLEHRADKDKNFTIDVVETPNLELEESPVQLAGRSVFCKADFEEVEVYNVPPTLCIENLPPQQRERARLVVNNREINIASDKISLASHITDGIIEIRLRGVRGRPTLKIAYFPELKLQLDKAEYRADETPTLSIGDQRFALQSNRHRVEIKFKGFVFSIPIPRKAWRITGKEWSSEPLSLRAQDLPSLQAQSFLEIAHIASSGKLIAKSGDTDLLTTLLRFEDGFCKVDLLRFRDIANANQEVELHLSLEGAEAVPLLRIYRSWQPEIKCEVSDKTVKFRITDNAAGFKNREIVCWNLCRLWEKPVVVSIPDGATEVEYAFEHDGEYVIEPRVKQTGWSKPKEPSPFDVPVEESEFSFSFKIGDNTFEKFKSQRENSLLDLLFERDNDPNTRRARISINEYLPALVYMIRHKAYYQTACNWLHLFLALREEIKGRFQVALYSEQHKSIELLRAKYEETVLRMTGFIGQPGIVSGIISRFPDGAEIAIALTAYPTNSGAKSGFLLCWNENPNHIRLTNVDLPHFLGKPRFVTTESLGFYSLLSQRDGNRAIATVGIAKKPLILCFQPVQLNQSQFKLIWRVLEADKVEITSFGEVEPQGERTVEPEHGQVFTLVAKSGHRSSHRSISTKFHSPHVKTFRG